MGSKSSLERRYGASLSTHGLGNERLRVFRKGRSLRLSCLRPRGNRINTGRTLTVAPPSRSRLSDRRIGPFRTVGPAPRRRTCDGAPFSVPVSSSRAAPVHRAGSASRKQAGRVAPRRSRGATRLSQPVGGQARSLLQACTASLGPIRAMGSKESRRERFEAIPRVRISPTYDVKNSRHAGHHFSLA